MPQKGKYYQPALPKIWENLMEKLLEHPSIKHEIRLRGWSLTSASVVKLAVWKFLEDSDRLHVIRKLSNTSTEPPR